VYMKKTLETDCQIRASARGREKELKPQEKQGKLPRTNNAKGWRAVQAGWPICIRGSIGTSRERGWKRGEAWRGVRRTTGQENSGGRRWGQEER